MKILVAVLFSMSAVASAQTSVSCANKSDIRLTASTTVKHTKSTPPAKGATGNTRRIK